MKILICDDNQTILDDLKKKITKIFSSLSKDNTVIIDTFCDANGLYDYIYDSKILPDAIIMDIFLGEAKENNGIDVAKKIKKEYKDINIIFCTGNKNAIEDVFEVDPLSVLFKPIENKKLADVMEKLYYHIMDAKNRCVTIKAVKGIHRLKMSEIKYLESQGRYVKIHIKDEEIVTINKLENLKNMFGKDFLQCHKSFVVNYNMIKKYEETKITLFDGTKIQVSRYYKKGIKDNLLNRI